MVEIILQVEWEGAEKERRIHRQIKNIIVKTHVCINVEIAKTGYKLGVFQGEKVLNLAAMPILLPINSEYIETRKGRGTKKYKISSIKVYFLIREVADKFHTGFDYLMESEAYRIGFVLLAKVRKGVIGEEPELEVPPFEIPFPVLSLNARIV